MMPPVDNAPDGANVESEITPEMVEAGCAALYDGGFPNEPTAGEQRALVRRVYSAMREARQIKPAGFPRAS